MLEINYQPLDLSKPDDKFVTIYQQQIKFLRDMKKKWFTFVFPDSKIKIDEEGNRRHNNGSWFDLSEQYSTMKDGTFSVRYYKNLSYDKKTGVKNLTPRKLNFNGYLSLSMDKDEDLIWFLIFASRHMEQADWLKPDSERLSPNLARTGRNIIYFKVENTVKTKEKEYALMSLVQQAMTAIYDNANGLSDEQIMYYARSYNIPLGENVSAQALRQELGSRVLVLDKKGNYNKTALDDFIATLPKKKDAGIDDRIAAQAVVNDLLRMNLVSHAPKGRRHVWMTKQGLEIMVFGSSQDPVEALVEFLAKDKDAIKEYEEIVKNEKGEQVQTS